MIKSAAITAVGAFGFDTTNDPIDSWLDEAKNQVESAFDWPFLQSVTTVSVAPGVSTIAMPADFFKVQSIRDNTNKMKLDYKDIVGFDRDIDDPTDTGVPVIYTVIAGGIQIWPVPDAQVSYRVLYQTTLGDITALGAGATLPGPTRFHYTYVIGAAMVGLQADNEEDRAQNAQAQFLSNLQRFIRKYSAHLDEAQQVVDAMGYQTRTQW